MNRIDQRFINLAKKNRCAFIGFITAGDPDLNTTKRLIMGLEGCGVDIIELGLPFSDPLADGPTIQASSERALKKGVNLRKVFSLVKSIRRKSSIPLALLSYYNPIFRYGEERFIKDSHRAGLDGVILPDLPPEEAGNLIALAKRQDIDIIFFLSPTSSLRRIKLVCKLSRGFIYYVSLTGVTGARERLPEDVLRNIQLIKRLTPKPVCIGFGISNPKQVTMLSKKADGVIVGSAIVNKVQENIGKKDLVRKVTHFAKELVKASV